MDILNKSTNLDFMDYSFCFDDTVPNSSTRNTTNNNATAENNQSKSTTSTNTQRNRTISSTYQIVGKKHDDDDDIDHCFSLDSYRDSLRIRNDYDFSSLPANEGNEATTIDENQYRYMNEASNSNELDKMKTRLTSLWHNVRYGWSSYVRKNKANFDKTTPICILGRFYAYEDEPYNYHHHPHHHHHHHNSRGLQTSIYNQIKDDFYFIDNNTASRETSLKNSGFKSFEEDIHSRLWFTYRKDFPPINGTKYTSDCGWGCMLRSAQMLLAQGFLMHFLGRNWSLFNEKSSNNFIFYREIISWFNDRLSNKCPFGLHRLLDIAETKMGKKVGDWFGPGAVILIIRDAFDIFAKQFIPILNNLCIYVAQDCTIYKQDVIDLCINANASSTSVSSTMSNNLQGMFKPVLLLISVRLGGEELNEIYVPTLKMFLEMENCLGIIGGKPKHSLYFIGYQDDKVIYLDPHVCQDSVDMSCLNSNYEFDNSSYHCTAPGKTLFTKLDPSLAIGFYCKTYDEFEKFCTFVENCTLNNSKLKQNELIHPIFSICDDKYDKMHLPYRFTNFDDDTLITSNHVGMISNNKPSPLRQTLSAAALSSNLNTSPFTHLAIKQTEQPTQYTETKTFNKRLQNLTKFNKLLSKSNDQKTASNKKTRSSTSHDLDDFVLI